MSLRLVTYILDTTDILYLSQDTTATVAGDKAILSVENKSADEYAVQKLQTKSITVPQEKESI